MRPRQSTAADDIGANARRRANDGRWRRTTGEAIAAMAWGQFDGMGVLWNPTAHVDRAAGFSGLWLVHINDQKETAGEGARRRARRRVRRWGDAKKT